MTDQNQAQLPPCRVQAENIVKIWRAVGDGNNDILLRQYIENALVDNRAEAAAGTGQAQTLNMEFVSQAATTAAETILRARSHGITDATWDREVQFIAAIIKAEFRELHKARLATSPVKVEDEKCCGKCFHPDSRDAQGFCQHPMAIATLPLESMPCSCRCDFSRPAPDERCPVVINKGTDLERQCKHGIHDNSLAHDYDPFPASRPASQAARRAAERIADEFKELLTTPSHLMHSKVPAMEIERIAVIIESELAKE